MPDEYDLRREARRDFRRLSIALILQELLVVAVAYKIQDLLVDYYWEQNPALTSGEIYDLLWNSGLDMIVASLVGLAVVLLFLWRRMPRGEAGERMRPHQFLLALVGVNGIQLLSLLISIPLENLVESLGYSLEQATEISTSSSVTVSMLLYSILVAPLVEELVFRGAVLRWLERWGRGFALVTSAVLFGLMHGNLVQLPVAVACGLLFGYIAQRFSLRAAFAAHAANNLCVELIGWIPEEADWAWSVYSALLLLCAAYVVYWCFTRRNELLDWYEREDEDVPAARWFLTSPFVLFLLLLYIVRTLQSALPV